MRKMLFVDGMGTTLMGIDCELKLPMVVVGLRQQWIGIASIVVVEGVEVEAPQIVVVVQEGFLAGPNIE